MFEEITIQRISTRTILKLTSIGLLLSLVPMTLLLGVCAFFGASTVSWNQQPMTGLSGLLAAPLIGLFLAVIFSVLLGLCMALGLWLYSKFRPLQIRIKKVQVPTLG
ncbi:hypothetical protein E9531_09805 [Lampropedia puyangensis]|uniref:DUF3566 domain-containing protein n=1 Tax=Lampropedia puyangensis TaxID=1330072 RepID=A0A4S8F3Q6_9BURK|nr:hypothetical protein [Lampropedia puyangensis]THU01065.1 hypothetical protein E9531_09805 [Lampropedia puyangensis]